MTTKRMLVAGVVAMAMLTAPVGLSVTTSGVALTDVSAHARAKVVGLDSHAIACRTLQQHGDALIAEYRNATPARREAIIAELRNNGRDWIAIGCKERFGSISLKIPRKPRVNVETPIGGPGVGGPGVVRE